MATFPASISYCFCACCFCPHVFLTFYTQTLFPPVYGCGIVGVCVFVCVCVYEVVGGLIKILMLFLLPTQSLVLLVGCGAGISTYAALCHNFLFLSLANSFCGLRHKVEWLYGY